MAKIQRGNDKRTARPARQNVAAPSKRLEVRNLLDRLLLTQYEVGSREALLTHPLLHLSADDRCFLSRDIPKLEGAIAGFRFRMTEIALYG